ncbi:unnamed protein product [Parajaminaea phylloscopi]
MRRHGVDAAEQKRRKRGTAVKWYEKSRQTATLERARGLRDFRNGDDQGGAARSDSRPRQRVRDNRSGRDFEPQAILDSAPPSRCRQDKKRHSMFALKRSATTWEYARALVAP